MKWDFAIAIKDEADLKSGHKRKKQGDILAVKPHPWKWGKKERKECLFVTVDGLTAEEAHARCQPWYDGDAPTSPEEKDTRKVLAKRKYKIPMATLSLTSEMDMSKVEDPEVEYQPLAGKTHSASVIKEKVASEGETK